MLVPLAQLVALKGLTATMTTTNTCNEGLSKFSYLAIVPRGLQSQISSTLQEQAKTVDGQLRVDVWNEDEDAETLREALRDHSIQKQEQLQKLEATKQRQKDHKNSHRPPRKIEFEERIASTWLPPGCSVGSVEVLSSGQHVSIGYFDDDNSEYIPSWSCTGQTTGSVWMQLETNDERISQSVVTPSRSMGPLVALVSVQNDNQCLEASAAPGDGDDDPLSHYRNYQQHSLDEMTDEIGRHISSNPKLFSKQFDRAMHIWKGCVDRTWKDRLATRDYEGLVGRIRDNTLRFRLSCMRVEPAAVPSSISRKRKKKFESISDLFSYSRVELCQSIMEKHGPKLVPDFYSEGNGKGSWTVDLHNFDIELVVFLVPPDIRSKHGKLAFGISLCPHSFLSSIPFGSGRIPSDVTMPCLGGEIISQGVVRLRPSTAHILLQMANLQPYDIVMDPCAGVGTIPVEAEYYQNSFETSLSCGNTNHPSKFLGIGGDVVLNNPKYTTIAGIMENAKTTKQHIGSSLLVAWDASHLPVRTASIDVTASDLPFGQQCLSANELNRLLPLIFLECARVLRPNTGRMVMLAGGSPIGIIANIEKLSKKYWKQPIPRVTPISIGGILAWIIVVVRNETPFDPNCSDDPQKLAMVRKVAEKRDRVSRQRKSEFGDQQTGKRKHG